MVMQATYYDKESTETNENELRGSVLYTWDHNMYFFKHIIDISLKKNHDNCR